MEQSLASTATHKISRMTSLRSHFRFRKTVIGIVAIACLLGGAISVGVSPVLTFLGELSRQKLAEQKVFLSFGEVTREGFGVTMHRVSIQLPDYNLTEQFNSVSIAVDLEQLLHLRPRFSVIALGLGGAINATIEPSWGESPTLTRLSLERIALRSSRTLAPIGFTDGIISGSLALNREPSSDCDSLTLPCYAVNITANQIETSQASELLLPKALRDAISLPGFSLGSSLFIPTIPRTNISVTLSLNNSRTLIHSVTLETKGIELTGTSAIPAGTGGTSTIGWYENVQASGSVQLDKTMAGLVALLPRSSAVQGSIAPQTLTNFTLAGPLLSPKLSLKPSERAETAY